MPKCWAILPASPDLARALSQRLRVSPLAGQLLINRGMTDVDGGRRFLRPQLKQLHEPDQMPGATEAAELLAAAVEAKRKITVYGDYDVDGVTGTSILWQLLRMVEADVDYYVPHRIDEGYGLNTEALEKLAADGTQVVVTVDCGITSVEPIRRAKELGLVVVVTDHHEQGQELPAADCIVHPRLPGSRYPFGELAGAGVAFKLAWAFAQRLSGATKVSDEFREFLVASVAMVALGTVADVVPLVDENRVLVRYGLQALVATPRPGIKALIEVSGLDGGRLGAYDVGFRLAPRLNAVGRLGHARLAVELMTTESMEKATEIARVLDQQNRKRQALESRLVRETRDRVEAELDLDATPAICLAGEKWHPGVMGIVASRLVDQFFRPTILVTLPGPEKRAANPAETLLAQGSGRSIPGFNLLEAIREAGDELASFGGHAYAAGLRVAPDRFETFRDRFYEVARQWLDPKDLVQEVRVDAEVPLKAVTAPVVKEFEFLAPFGRENPAPVFVSRGLDVVGLPRCVGGGGRHLSFMVSQAGTTHKAIAFGMGDRLDEVVGDKRCDLVYEPAMNHWQGRTTVDLQVKDMRVL